MSYNPAHATGGNSRKRPRPAPHGGIKHSAITGRHGPVGVSLADVQNRVVTPSGWRIPYFKGDTFEVFYELICARNTTGKLKHETKDRLVRVLAGRLFVSWEGRIDTVLSNQACSFSKGTEYEFASSGDSDVELLVVQDSGYEESLEHITAAEAVNSIAIVPFTELGPGPGKVSSERAVASASRIAEERVAKAHHKGRPQAKRPPLPGQQVVGVNPRPVGAGGFSEE